MSNIPKLRFPEFKGEWEEKRLSDFMTRLTRKNSNNESSRALTISSVDGLIDQGEFFKKQIASKDTSGYYLLKKGDFAYNKSYSVGYDYGSIKRLDKYEDGVVSTLYICMSLTSDTNSDYLTHYFDSMKWNKSVSEISAEGARNHGLLNIPTESFFQTKHYLAPTLAEQQKIADFLSNVDSIITAEAKILNTLQKKKKALMQKLFTQQLRFKSDDGTDFPTWEEKKLGEISSSPKYGLNASGIDYDGEHKYLRITDIDEVTHTFSPEEITTPSEFSDDYLLKENDIVFARTGASTGKTYLYNPNDGDLYFAGFLIKFHIKDANARFVFYQTCTHEYEKWVHVMSTRSGQPGINSEEYSTLKIKLPCIEEQQKIADCLSSMDSLIQNQQKVVTIWQQRKKALLQQMFV